MPTLVTTKFEARTERRQRATVVRAEDAVTAVDRLYHRAWNELMGLLGQIAAQATEGQPHFVAGAMQQRIRQLVFALLGDSIEKIGSELQGVVGDVYQGTTEDLIRTIPRAQWVKLAKRKRGVREGRDPFFNKALAFAQRVLNSIAEIDPDYQALIDGEDLTDVEFRDLVKRVVFPPPNKQKVSQILRSDRWPDRKEWPQRLKEEGFSFDKIVGQVTSGFAQGENIQQISMRLRPLVDNVRYRATRIARTESLRVASTIQRDSFDKVDDLIIGYKINAVLDSRTRPEHAERDGRIYWKAGHGDGAFDIAQLPDLPDEPNCRCYATPLFAGIDE